MKKSDKDVIKKLSKDILIGIITWVICYILEKIVSSAPKTGKTILGTIQNQVYSSAAKISSNSLITIILVLFLSTIAAFAIVPFLFSFFGRKKENEIKEKEKKIEKIYAKIEEYEKDFPKYSQEIKNCLKEINKLDKEIEDNSTTQKEKQQSISPIIITITYLVCIFMTEIVPISKLDSFNRDLKMIKPYTDSKTVLMLESDWTRMKSKDDYDKIYETINKIKDENNLPKK